MSNPNSSPRPIPAKDWRFEAAPIRRLLVDPTISEIMINRFDRIFIERAGVIEETDCRFDDAETLLRLAQAIAVSIGKELNRSHPIFDGRLPDGSRINIAIPPVSLEGATLTIRKFNPVRLNHAQLVQAGSFDEKILYFLNQAVIQKLNIVVSGGTGSGKTTLLNMLTQFISPKERLVTIEDTAELQVNVKNSVRLESKISHHSEGTSITMQDLLKYSLRMRPDRILVGECRGGEAWDMLQAMNTGHKGSMTTLHAHSAFDALSRIENMIMRAGMDVPLNMIKEDISQTVDLVIQADRCGDGKRRVIEILEVSGRDGEEYQTLSLFHWSAENGFRSTGAVPRFVSEANGAINLKPEFFDPGFKVKLAV
jgi:pilus assembly protein CpaF